MRHAQSERRRILVFPINAGVYRKKSSFTLNDRTSIARIRVVLLVRHLTIELSAIYLETCRSDKLFRTDTYLVCSHTPHAVQINKN